MAGKEKENMKRKGKQRLVGEMAIRWIAVVYFCKFFQWEFIFVRHYVRIFCKFSCWRFFSSVRRIGTKQVSRCGQLMRENL
jgi:hypothetical protein